MSLPLWLPKTMRQHNASACRKAHGWPERSRIAPCRECFCGNGDCPLRSCVGNRRVDKHPAHAPPPRVRMHQQPRNRPPSWRLGQCDHADGLTVNHTFKPTRLVTRAPYAVVDSVCNQSEVPSKPSRYLPILAARQFAEEAGGRKRACRMAIRCNAVGMLMSTLFGKFR